MKGMYCYYYYYYFYLVAIFLCELMSANFFLQQQVLKIIVRK